MATFNGTALNDRLTGSDDDDVLDGFEGNDTLYGAGGNDQLYGGDGDDWVDGGGGLDTLDGGSGNDIYLVRNQSNVVVEAVDSGIDTAIAATNYTLIANVENLQLLGNNALVGVGNSLDNVIKGNSVANNLNGEAGDDTLYGDAGNDLIDGGTGNDLLYGGANDDVLYGKDGDDSLWGEEGNDFLWGGDGVDSLYGGSGNDTYVIDQTGDSTDRMIELANEGTDTVVSSISYILGENLENLTLGYTDTPINGTGNSLNNTIVGNDSDNRLSGMGGNDVINGGGGNDSLDGGVGNDMLDGGAGDDRLDVSDGNDTLVGGAGFDTVISTVGQNYVLTNDRLTFYVPGPSTSQLFTQILQGIEAAHLTIRDTGAPQNINASAFTGNATLIGSNSADTLIGGLGNDTLNGRGGANVLNGGAGFDTAQITGLSNVIYANGTLGSGGDRNQLNQIEAVEVIGTDNNDFLNLSALPLTFTSSIQGGNGDDTLVGSLSSTFLDGGAGNDTARFQVGNLNFRLTDTRLTTNNNDVVNLASIEAVEITGGNLANVMNGSASTKALNLIGGAGNDTLQGGAGNDLLEGGMDTNQLYGGAGVDTFRSSSYYSGLQVIHDFDRATEKLDFIGSDGVKYLSSRDIRVTREGNDSLVSVGNTTLFQIKNALVDSRNFVNLKDPTLSNLPLSTDARSDVGLLIREWARSYADYRSTTAGKPVSFKDVSTTAGGTDPLLNGVTFTVGDLTFSNTRPIAEPEFAASGRSTVRTTAGGAVGFAYQYSKADISQTTISNAFKIGTKVGGKMAHTFRKTPGNIGVDTTIEYNFEVNFDYTRTTSTTEGRTTTNTFTETSTINLLPSSVSTVEGGAIMFRETSDFSTNIAVKGDIKLSFDGINDVSIPIAAVLQSYMPEVFKGSGRVVEMTLAAEGDPGTFLSYYSDTTFTQTGTIDLVPFVRQDVRVTSEVQDDDLTNPVLRSYGAKLNETGSYAERFWVARGDLPNRGSVMGDDGTLQPITLELTGFNRFEDKIGVFVPGISRYDDLTESAIQVQVQGTGLNGQSTTSLVDSTRISSGSTTLVDVVGLTPNQLDASHFVFDTRGSIFDSTIARH